MKLDEYCFKARLIPTFLTILPLLLTIICLWAPEASKLKYTFTSFSLIAISIFGANFGRDYGKLKEEKLWKSWGGPPATRFLRHSDNHLNSIVKTHYHAILQKLVPGINLPTPIQEKKYPTKIDEAYSACIHFLVINTRDKNRFPLIYKENINYGFRRNLWGLKSIGIFFNLIGIAGVGCYFFIEHNSNGVDIEALIIFLINLVILALWILWVRPDGVKIAAEAYAERLLEACNNLKQ